MSRKRRTTKRSRRGSLRDWASKGHSYMKSNNGYSKGLSMAYNKYGKHQVNKRLSKENAGLVNKGVSMALAKLKQSGYGRLRGSGLRRSGNGLRLAGGSNRLKY